MRHEDTKQAHIEADGHGKRRLWGIFRGYLTTTIVRIHIYVLRALEGYIGGQRGSIGVHRWSIGVHRGSIGGP